MELECERDDTNSQDSDNSEQENVKVEKVNLFATVEGDGSITMTAPEE